MFENLLNGKSYRYTMYALGGLVILSLIIALVPSFRDSAQNWLWSNERNILAKSQGQLEPGGLFVTAIKVETKDGMYLELYKSDKEDSAPELMTQFPLEGTRDGFYNFHAQATNLVLTDFDRDGYLDVIAPTYDDRQQPRMNVFRYNAELEVFQRHEQ